MQSHTRIFQALTVLFGFGFTVAAHAAPKGKSDLPNPRVVGIKWPNSPHEGTAPVETFAELATAPLGGYSQLVPYVIASPDQEDAGSCLYMSLTGITEWWLARLNPRKSRVHDGPLDLSERYMMNLAGIEEDDSSVANWKTDSIFLYNNAGHAVRNTAYRFTKGWYTLDGDGDPQASTKGTSGAEYGTLFNWIDHSHALRTGFVNLPTFDREIIFADPAGNQWNTGVMPADIVDRVKAKIKDRQAPVHVIYNHFGYWHAVYIVGFDDLASSRGCSFVTQFDQYMPNEAAKLRTQAASTKDAKKKADLLARADKFDRLGKQFHDAYTAGGGCSGKGMFYVRDSIYTNTSDPYDFDPSDTSGRGSYSKAIVLHEYEWLRYMANHATQIFVK